MNELSMRPEEFNTLSYAERKEVLASKYMTEIDPTTAERSCGDGRRAVNAKGPFVKNFGASLGAASVELVSSWDGKTDSDFSQRISESFAKLKNTGHDLGAHRDDHNHDSTTASGCGFADNRANIFERIASTDDFQNIVGDVFKEVCGDIIGENQAKWDKIMGNYEEVAEAQRTDDNFTPTGEKLISILEEEDPSVLELTGDHKEYAIIFNYIPNTTLDTNGLIDDGGSAFCVDAWDAVQQTKDLGIEEIRAKLIYMAEWVATAIVLTVDKGGELPPIFHVTQEYLDSLK